MVITTAAIATPVELFIMQGKVVLTFVEIHFLFYRSKYATTRDNFYKKIQPFIQNVSRLPVSDLILELMNSSNFFVNMQLIKFISSCFDSRNKMLSM